MEKKSRENASEIGIAQTHLTKQVLETVQGMQVIKSYNLGGKNNKELSNAFEENCKPTGPCCRTPTKSTRDRSCAFRRSDPDSGGHAPLTTDPASGPVAGSVLIRRPGSPHEKATLSRDLFLRHPDLAPRTNHFPPLFQTNALISRAIWQ